MSRTVIITAAFIGGLGCYETQKPGSLARLYRAFLVGVSTQLQQQTWKPLVATLGLGVVGMIAYLGRQSPRITEDSEPALIQKHSTFESFQTKSYTYSSIRVWYRDHPQADKLSTPPLPLLVFVHGLGGSLSQFSELLNGLVNTAPCLAFDLPGCGFSAFSPQNWDAYSTENLVELIQTIVDKYRDKEHHQKIVLVGHSMGCSLSALLASEKRHIANNLSAVSLGLIALCPRHGPASEREKLAVRRLLWVPNWLFNLWRLYDKWGGLNSHSVVRFVGEKADSKTRSLQLRYNTQSSTPVLRRMLGGLVEALPGPDIWSGLDCSVFLLGGAADKVTKPEDVDIIAQSLKQKLAADSPEEAGTSSNETPHKVLKVTILPSATHGMMYSTATIRAITGLISDFLTSHVDRRLCMGFQLQYLLTEQKWDVKNLVKWQAVTPVSDVIGKTFRVLKTLREVDTLHNPEVFATTWGYDGTHKDRILDVIDIGHDAPVYDPRSLQTHNVHYHKFPTVSKYPPTLYEVADFIVLVDSLLATGEERYPPPAPKGLVGVHCHYGYNRSGFFVVCYMIEKLSYSLQQALDEFATKRPQGIKHAHFIDELFARYTVA